MVVETMLLIRFRQEAYNDRAVENVIVSATLSFQVSYLKLLYGIVSTTLFFQASCVKLLNVIVSTTISFQASCLKRRYNGI
jgi:hypothetical protein